jgi:hypothetical protein
LERGDGSRETFPIRVEDRGYLQIGDEPGSGPQPFIIVEYDETLSRLGLIFPYVTVLRKFKDIVSLHIGGDASRIEPIKDNCPILYEECDGDDVSEKQDRYGLKTPSATEQYLVKYLDLDTVFSNKAWCCVFFHSFGQPLPNHSDPVRYERIYDLL